MDGRSWFDYWLTWRTVVKFTYEAIKTTNNSGINADVLQVLCKSINSMHPHPATQLDKLF